MRLPLGKPTLTDRPAALREFPDRRRALASQDPTLILTVGYAMVGLWILAQPIVETGAG